MKSIIITTSVLLVCFVLFKTSVATSEDDGPLVIQSTSPIEHGEEPHWDPVNGVLYFVDIHQQRVYRYNPETNETTSIFIDGGDVTPVIPIRDRENEFAVGVGRQLMLLHWDGRNLTHGEFAETKPFSEVDSDKPKNRFNDGKADELGRIWIGTMGYEDASGVDPNQGSLFKITEEDLENPVKMITPVSISNGLAWTEDNSKFYYIDSSTLKVYRYDFDLKNGELSNKTIVFDLGKNNISAAIPDGMTIDTDGNLWVALFKGASVIKVDPRTGELLQRIAIPASQVTSCAFGGKDLDVLYVTTSNYGLTDEEREQQPAAGAVFVIHNLQARGLPAFTAVV